NQYRAVFTNALGTAQTTALLTVNVPPTVTTNPASQTICAGSPVSFIAAATATPAASVQWQLPTNGGANSANIGAAPSASFTAAASASPAATVQWQLNTGSGFNDIVGATSATLTFTATAGQTGNQYRAVFTNTCGTATTGAATLTVNVPPAVTTQPVNQ